jgi:hypothetical protein
VLERYRHAYLLASLLLLVLVQPFLGERLLGLALIDVFLIVTLVTCIVTCSTTRRQLVIGVVLAAALEVARWSTLISDHRALLSAHPGLGLLFFVYVTVLMAREIFGRARKVSLDTIAGALSIYLLLGLAWTFAYALLEIAVPGSFSFGGVAPGPQGSDFSRFLGFSFVTLTTLGYGNIVPTNPRADALTSTEALVGQIYLAVLVARLIAIQLQQAHARRAGERTADADTKEE